MYNSEHYIDWPDSQGFYWFHGFLSEKEKENGINQIAPYKAVPKTIVRAGKYSDGIYCFCEGKQIHRNTIFGKFEPVVLPISMLMCDFTRIC